MAKNIIGKDLWPELDSNKRFKELFFNLWKVFPDGLVRGEVEKVIKNGGLRDRLEKHGFLYSEEINIDGKTHKQWSLGPQGVSKVIAWETQSRTLTIAKFAGIFGLMVAVIGGFTTVIIQNHIGGRTLTEAPNAYGIVFLFVAFVVGICFIAMDRLLKNETRI